MFDVVEWKCWGTYIFIQLKKLKVRYRRGLQIFIQFTLKSFTTSLQRKGWRDPLTLVFLHNIDKVTWKTCQNLAHSISVDLLVRARLVVRAPEW